MNARIVKIPLSEMPTLSTMLQEYLQELCNYAPMKQNSDGIFEYPWLQYY